jgi:hypothetical protein
LAPDGRFISIRDNHGGEGLLDTRTEKICPRRPSFYQAEFGWVGSGWVNDTFVLSRLPPPDRLNIPPDLLDLWAQVAVRGHLDDEGAFVKCDEPTWERKRQELAANSAPWLDYPFPGYVATDRLHWLRAEFANAEQADRPGVAKQLLDRSEATGDQVEAVRWQSWLSRQAK